MAERIPEAPLLHPIDPIEDHIHKKFDHLIVCLNRRREQLIAQYKERQAEKQAAATSRIKTIHELTDTKAELITKMKENFFHTIRERWIDEIDTKMKQLEVIDREVELMFMCGTQQLEKTISDLGQLVEKGSVPTTKETDRVRGDKWEIDRHTLKIARKLEAGSLCEIWQGIWKNSCIVAIKSPRLDTISRENFLTEAAKMKKLRHNNVIQLYGVCSLEDPLHIVTEYMVKGSLLKLLQKKGAAMEEPELINFGFQVAHGMAYLESHKCIHMNLAARNVLVGENNQVKVADFRMAQFIDENKDIYEAPQGIKFPIKWAPPEARNMRFSIKSDVWSFGILLMEIMTLGNDPYPGMTSNQVLTEVSAPINYRMPKPNNCPDYLYQTMLDCWNVVADRRPTFYYLSSQLEDFSVEAEQFFTLVLNK